MLSFRNLRYSVNAGPQAIGATPSGNFTTLPGIIALDNENVGLWLGRADGYMASELFFFGINTAVRLGYAPGNGTQMRNPVTGKLVHAMGADPGSLLPAHGPWGSISGMLVDLAQFGIHFVWPNPLTNRFTNIQLYA